MPRVARVSALPELSTSWPDRDAWLGEELRTAPAGTQIRIHSKDCANNGTKRCQCVPVLLITGATA